MKVLCSLWLCLGKGDVKVAEKEEVSPCAKANKVLAADGDVEVKRNDGEKQRPFTDNAFGNCDTAAWRAASLGGAKGCEGSAGKSPGVVVDALAKKERQSALAGDLLRNERTLRALLQKAKIALSEQNQAFTLERQDPPAFYPAGPGSASDPELGRLNAQLLDTCRAPKPDPRALLRLELLLGEVRRWLAVRPCPAAATAVLYAVGDGLVHAEHAVRSVGLVRYWQPDNASVFLALLQLYSDLLVQANRAAQLQRQRQQQPNQQDKDGQAQQQTSEQERKKDGEPLLQQRGSNGSGSDVVVLAADQEALQQQRQRPSSSPEKLAPAMVLAPQASELSLECSEQGLPARRSGGALAPGLGQPQRQPQEPLTFAVAALLLRPDWLDMLAEALELLHFSEEYRLAAVRGGREPQEALARALRLWCFLTQLVKFAAAHADSVQRMEPCLQRLGALLAPPAGAVPRLLELPLAEDTLVAQLHALWLLQVLYDMPDAKVLYSTPLAEYYVALHHNAMLQSYEASAADPKSASAELCRIHATLLRSLARHPGPPVRAAFARVRTVAWILQELSLESQLLAAAQQDGEAGEDLEDSEDEDEDSDITASTTGSDEDPAAAAASGETPEREVGGGGEGMGPLSPVAPVAPGSAPAGERPPPPPAPAPPAASRKASKGFSFTYDLNEDVERLIALEDEMGQEMELDGFEYDEEGKQLKARSDAMAAAAAAAAAAAPPTPVEPAAPPPLDGQQQQQQLTPQVSVGRRTDLYSYGSFGSNSPSRHNSGVPRLALVGLRTASISSLAAHSPAGRRPPGGRSSHTGASSSCRGAEEEEDCDGPVGDEPEPLSDEVRTPSPDAIAVATAAERVAVWSSTLAEAYAAASAGDESKLPYPPPRTQSRGSGGFGGGAPLPPLPPAPPFGSYDQPQLPQRPASVEGAATAGAAGGETGQPARPREVTTGSPVHAGPQGELHIMVQSSGSVRAAQAAAGAPPPATAVLAHGRPPLPTKPALPPLKMGSGVSLLDTTGAAAQPAQALSSARAGPQPGSSRAMMMLSASNRYNNSSGAPLASSPNGAATAQQGPPWTARTAATPTSSAPSPVRDLGRQFHSISEGSAFLSDRQHQQKQPPSNAPSPAPASSASVAPAPAAVAEFAGGSPRRPPVPLIPALNLKSLRRRDGGAGGATTDTGRTVPLSSMLRATDAGSLSNYSAMDSANTLLRSGGTTATPISSANTTTNAATATNPPSSRCGGGGAPWRAGSGPLQRITETEVRPPEVAYQELACQRLLYQDRATHILLLKVLVDLLVSPVGALDPAYVPQYPAHSGVPHAEFILLWHLNAPRNGGVVHDLCRGAQRRAQQAAAAAARRAAAAAAAVEAAAVAAPASCPASGVSPLQQHPSADLVRRYSAVGDSSQRSQPAAAASLPPAAQALTPVPSRASAVTRALQLLSRPLFDASRYTNLQFVARGTFGDIYRARMEPQPTQAWPSPRAPGHHQPSAAAAETVAAATGTVAAAAETVAAPPQAAAPMQVVIKTIQLPGSPHDSCVLADVFGEVSVMERFRGHDCICQLLDYGMRDDAYWLVMRRYRCSLAEWRGRQKPLGDLLQAGAASGGAAAAAARVYLSALAQVVDALQLLASHHVVHFDLKCSNVLIEPLPGVRDGELWAPVSGAATARNGGAGGDVHCVPFRCVLADFGEARAYRCAEEAFTARNRGTEVFKSPEMLLLNAASRPSGSLTPPPPPPPPTITPPATPTPAPATSQSPSCRGSAAPSSPASTSRGAAAALPPPPGSRPGTANTSRHRPPQHALSGAGLASDVWSLGCLAYELLSGTVLFGGDYASVTHRVAFGAGEHLTLMEPERARLAHLPQLVGLVEWILARDPAKRPSLEAIRERIDQIRVSLA